MAVLDLIPTLTGTEKLSEITPKETNEKFTPANPGFIFNFDLSFGKEQIEFSFFKTREKFVYSLPKDESKKSKKTVEVEIDTTNEDEEDSDRLATIAESTNQLNDSESDDKEINESSQSFISSSNHTSSLSNLIGFVATAKYSQEHRKEMRIIMNHYPVMLINSSVETGVSNMDKLLKTGNEGLIYDYRLISKDFKQTYDYIVQIKSAMNTKNLKPAQLYHNQMISCMKPSDGIRFTQNLND